MSDNNIVTDKELQYDERISAYLRGEMNADEEAAFKKELESDEELRSKAIDTAYLAKAMKDVGNEIDANVKEAMMATNKDNVERIAAKVIGNYEKANEHLERAKQMEVAYYEETPEQAKRWEEDWKILKENERKRKTFRRRIVIALSTAACIAMLCVISIQYHDYRTTTGLGKQYAIAFINEQKSSIRGIKSPTSKELAKLYAKVQNGKDLDATIKRLSVLWEVSTLDTYNDYTDDAPLIGWNLAIANLKNNDKDAAKDVLTKLVSKTEEGSAVNMKAKELLREL